MSRYVPPTPSNAALAELYRRIAARSAVDDVGLLDDVLTALEHEPIDLDREASIPYGFLSRHAKQSAEGTTMLGEWLVQSWLERGCDASGGAFGWLLGSKNPHLPRLEEALRGRTEQLLQKLERADAHPRVSRAAATALARWDGRRPDVVEAVLRWSTRFPDEGLPRGLRVEAPGSEALIGLLVQRAAMDPVEMGLPPKKDEAATIACLRGLMTLRERWAQAIAERWSAFPWTTRGEASVMHPLATHWQRRSKGLDDLIEDPFMMELVDGLPGHSRVGRAFLVRRGVIGLRDLPEGELEHDPDEVYATVLREGTGTVRTLSIAAGLVKTFGHVHRQLLEHTLSSPEVDRSNCGLFWRMVALEDDDLGREIAERILFDPVRPAGRDEYRAVRDMMTSRVLEGAPRPNGGFVTTVVDRLDELLRVIVDDADLAPGVVGFLSLLPLDEGQRSRVRRAYEPHLGSGSLPLDYDPAADHDVISVPPLARALRAALEGEAEVGSYQPWRNGGLSWELFVRLSGFSEEELPAALNLLEGLSDPALWVLAEEVLNRWTSPEESTAFGRLLLVALHRQPIESSRGQQRLRRALVRLECMVASDLPASEVPKIPKVPRTVGAVVKLARRLEIDGPLGLRSGARSKGLAGLASDLVALYKASNGLSGLRVPPVERRAGLVARLGAQVDNHRLDLGGPADAPLQCGDVLVNVADVVPFAESAGGDTLVLAPGLAPEDGPVPVMACLHDQALECEVVAPSLTAWLGAEVLRAWARKEGMVAEVEASLR